MNIKALTNQIRSNKTWLDFIASWRKCSTLRDRAVCLWNALKESRFLLTYMILYFIMFTALEQSPRTHYNLIHMAVDEQIPFLEVFVVPYLLWFAYVLVIMVYLYFADREYYHRTSLFICIGMTLFLVISALWPNALALRPLAMPRDNLFTAMVTHLYMTDTATNVFPSIHVFNSIGMMLGFLKCRGPYASRKAPRAAVTIMGILIILSVVFIKQHSVFDVFGAFAISIPIYLFSFSDQPEYAHSREYIAAAIRGHLE